MLFSMCLFLKGMAGNGLCILPNLFYIFEIRVEDILLFIKNIYKNAKSQKSSLSLLQHGSIPQSKSFWAEVFGIAN